MNSELKYPIKYAVLELKKTGGYSDDYKDVTIGFIASKCYLVESRTIYREDGEVRIRHLVVFPYSEFTNFYLPYETDGLRLPKEDEPKYNARNNPYPVRIVEKLFDSYKEAKMEANICNLNFMKENIAILYPEKGENWKDIIAKFQKKFDSNIERCNLFEKMVEEATKGNKVTKNVKVNTLEQVK